ncbi:hypothetical protein MBLNU230_g4567t1 [Neophaeotheca triangularis]
MAKGSKLKSMLDNYKGVDHKLEKQRKQEKEAEKRKRSRKQSDVDLDALEAAVAGVEKGEAAKAKANGGKQKKKEAAAAEAAEKLAKTTDGEAGGWETDESSDAEEEDGGVDFEGIDDSDSDSDEEQDLQNSSDDEEGEDEDDIPLSDIESLASEDKGDVIPHQRLTINNTAALERSLKSFALPKSLPFSATQAVLASEPTKITDAEDDLSRESAFLEQALNAAKEARSKLSSEGVPFSRPNDYFAEMVKSEEQMGKVRAKMVDEAARKKASSDARRQRDLKKFGKQVQVAKMQERDKAKRETLDKINLLKRKRQGADVGAANENDMFDIGLEEETEKPGEDRRRASKGDREAGGRNSKRQKKDDKFGFGGKKRFAKSNDAKSASDMRGFSQKKMKGKPRPGKSKRAKA